MLRAAGALLLACGISACAPPIARLPLYAPPTQPSDDQTLADLTRLRSLPLDAPVAIETMDDAGFLGAYHAMLRATGKEGHAGAFWNAFAMSEPSTDVMAMAQSITDDDLGGFYDPRVKRLYVRRRAKPSASGYDRLTLAHEEEHALQDRFFGMPDFSTIRDADELLALRALFEGDATVASALLDAGRRGTSSVEGIARLARLVPDDPLLLRASGVYAAEGVPPLLRAELVWPYVRGSSFVAELAASGGWTLVNAALRNPPKTTEQVLHVEKYIAGEGAVDVRAPAAPEGYVSVESGRMGELRTRFFLAQCAPDWIATASASGWGGDAYTIAAQGAEHALLWSTAWDDEDAAKRFAAALEERRACARTGAKHEFTVVRDGMRVAFVQGLADEPSRAQEGAKLFSLVGQAPPPIPPVGEVKLLRPPVSNDFSHAGVVLAGRFSDPSLGITSDLKDLQAKKSRLLELSAFSQFANVAIVFAWSPPSGALAEESVANFVTGLRKMNPGEPVFDKGTSTVLLSSTTADARALRLGNRLDVRLVLAPACQGRMTFILISTWKPGTPGAATADAWLRSVRLSESFPACEALKRLRDPAEP
jgi:hypothetical protein